MIGDRVRAQREARGWTQEHLSEAAGIAVRTVQRIESRHSHSAETLLAIAAAFDVDPRELTRPQATSHGEHRPLWPSLDPKRAARIAAVLVAPAAVFVSLSLLKYGAGFAAPYDLLAGFGARHQLHAAFDRLSAPILLYSPLLALVLAAMASIRPAGLVERDTVTVTGVELTWHWPTVLAAMTALAVLGLLTLYIVGEKLAQVAQVAAG
jgi:transcriptional regulator with XRE-family HTH domain